MLIFHGTTEMLEVLTKELERAELYSQKEAAAYLGISDRSLRTPWWNTQFNWVHYWCLDQLVQDGQYTWRGMVALCCFQRYCKKKFLKLKNGKVVRNRNGKPALLVSNASQIMTVPEYAAKVWALNGIPPNPEPFHSGELDRESTKVIAEATTTATEQQLEADLDDAVIEGEILTPTSTALTFGNIDQGWLEEFTDTQDGEVSTILANYSGNLGGLAQLILSKADHDGRVLGTLSGKQLLASMQQAQAEVIQRAAGIVDDSPVQQQAEQAAPLTNQVRNIRRRKTS